MDFKNVAVIHSSGSLCFSKAFDGEPLDASILTGLSFSVSSFISTLLSNNIHSATTTSQPKPDQAREMITSSGQRLLFRNAGEFSIVCHTGFKISSSVVHTILTDLIALLEMLFGSCEQWEESVFDATGAQDILCSFFAPKPYTSTITNCSSVCDPWVLTGGQNTVNIDLAVNQRLLKLLGELEAQDSVCGNGTMLSLGSSILASRLPVKEARLIMQYLKHRPINSVSTRYTPIYKNGAWFNLYICKVGPYLLSITCEIDKPFTLIQKGIQSFSSSLSASNLEIPEEEPPVLLRSFAKRQVLAFMYHNFKTGITLFPQLRQAPQQQQTELLLAFWQFFYDAQQTLRLPGGQVEQFYIVRDSFRFLAIFEGVHQLFVLLGGATGHADSSNSGGVGASESMQEAMEVSFNVLKQIKTLIPQ